MIWTEINHNIANLIVITEFYVRKHCKVAFYFRRSTNKQEDTSLTANYESRRVERHIDHTPSGSVHSKGMAPGLSFLEEPSTTPKVDRTLMF